jgi:hypothetical protein
METSTFIPGFSSMPGMSGSTPSILRPRSTEGAVRSYRHHRTFDGAAVGVMGLLKLGKDIAKGGVAKRRVGSYRLGRFGNIQVRHSGPGFTIVSHSSAPAAADTGERYTRQAERRVSKNGTTELVAAPHSWALTPPTVAGKAPL